MNLPRIFANAIARRVAFVVVGAVCALLAQCFAPARAQGAHPDCFNTSVATASCPDRGAAHAGARAYVEASLGGGTNPRACLIADTNGSGAVEYARSSWTGTANVCPPIGVPQRRGRRTYTVECQPGGTWNDETKSCDSCSSKPPLGAGTWSGVNGDMQMCQDGCTFQGGSGGGSGVGVCLPVVIDGTTYHHCTSWGPTGDQCSAGVGNGSLAPPDSDGDGSSDGNDGSPNNPGSGGSGSDGKPGEDGSSACGGPDQPPCESDGSNSGSGKGNTSGGGGNCQTPPSSTGDAILAQIAFQTWATRCAIAGNANGGVGGGSGNGEGDGDQPDWTKGDGPAPAEDDTDYVEQQRRFGLGINADMLDQENLFGSSSCPQISFTFWKVNVNTVNFPWWCQVVEWMGYAVMLIGAWTALNILLGRSPI